MRERERETRFSRRVSNSHLVSLHPGAPRYYSLMSVGYGQAYQNQRAYDVRPIYATRFIGWAFAVPILLFMCLGSKKDQEGAVAARNQPWSLGGWCSQGSFWFWTIVVCWMFCLQYIGTCVGNNHIFYNPNWLPRHFCVGFLPPTAAHLWLVPVRKSP